VAITTSIFILFIKHSIYRSSFMIKTHY